MKQRMTVVSCLKVFQQINVPDVAGTASAINATKLKETRAHTYFMSAGPGGGGGKGTLVPSTVSNTRSKLHASSQ